MKNIQAAKVKDIDIPKTVIYQPPQHQVSWHQIRKAENDISLQRSAGEGGLWVFRGNRDDKVDRNETTIPAKVKSWNI